MFAVMTNTHDNGESVLYGPFTSKEAAGHYARYHGIEAYIIVRLHDCGSAMEFEPE